MPGRELNFGVAPCVYYMGCVKGERGLYGWVVGADFELRRGDDPNHRLA